MGDNVVVDTRYPQARLTHTTQSVSGSSVEAVAANADRMYLLLINDSTDTLYIKFGESAVANEGIRLGANGGSMEVSARNGNLDTRAVNVISSGTSSNLLVTEGD